jgi:hypothetical protein
MRNAEPLELPDDEPIIPRPRKKNPHLFVWGLIAVMAAGIIFLVAQIAQEYRLGRKSRTQASPSTSEIRNTPAAPRTAPSPSAATVTTTATKLQDDYWFNVALGDSRYLGKTVKLVSMVMEIEKIDGVYSIGLESGPNVMPNGSVLKSSVVCWVSPSQTDLVAGLKKFDNISIAGECIGMVKSPGRMKGILITLKDCRMEVER